MNAGLVKPLAFDTKKSSFSYNSAFYIDLNTRLHIPIPVLALGLVHALQPVHVLDRVFRLPVIAHAQTLIHLAGSMYLGWMGPVLMTAAMAG